MAARVLPHRDLPAPVFFTYAEESLMHWFPFYASDFIGATAGLSLSERALYTLMLVFYYEVGPFPTERIRVYRIVGCESDEQKRAVDHLLGEFFVQMADGWYQEKAERVKCDMRSRSDRARAKAGKRWHPDAVHDATALPQQCHSNAGAMLTTTTTTTTTKPTTKPTTHSDLPFALSDASDSKRPSKRQTPRAAGAHDAALPKWFPLDRLEAFRQHRRALRKPLTAEAERLLVLKLDKLRAQGHDPMELLN
ncbi:MAG: DUF1376 domain-containing protein, partial [Gammaproteobacteria bacterium]